MIPFSESERAMLSVCQLQAGAPLHEIASQAGLSSRAARRTLDRLQSRGVLTPYVLINHFAQGMLEVGLYVTLGAGGPDSEKRIGRFIESNASIASVTELGGAYSLCLDLLVTHISELPQLLEDLAVQTGCAILAKASVIRSSRTVYQRKFFGPTPKKMSVSMELGPTVERLDAVDKKILDTCVRFPSLSHRELASRAKIPQSTFEYRLKLLTERKVFAGFAFAFRSETAGVPTFRILAHVKKPSAKGSRALEAFCKTHTNTVTFNNCIGAWDHEIRVEFDNPSEVNRFRHAILTAFPDYLADAAVLPYLGTRKLSSFSP